LTFSDFEFEIDRLKNRTFRFISLEFHLFTETEDDVILDGIGRRGTETNVSGVATSGLQLFRADNGQVCFDEETSWPNSGVSRFESGTWMSLKRETFGVGREVRKFRTSPVQKFHPLP
jgi:hypothetical protein